MEMERDFLHANRVRDEYQYAQRFGLKWPSPSLASRSASVALVGSSEPGGFTVNRTDELELAKKKTEGDGKDSHTKKPPPKRTKKADKNPKPTKKPIGANQGAPARTDQETGPRAHQEAAEADRPAAEIGISRSKIEQVKTWEDITTADVSWRWFPP